MTSTVKIPEGWIETKLGEIATFQQGFQISTDFQELEKKEGYVRFVRIVDYTNEGEKPRYIEDPHRCFVNEDDLVMIRYGSQTAGKIVRGISGVIANNTFQVITGNNTNKNRLYRNLKQESVYNYLNRDQSSSTMPAITFSQVSKLQILLPPLPEQKAIAGVLSSFDDKIELLRAENQTLEEMGQTLFKERFGKYKVGDELPDGWKVGKLGDIIDFIIDNRGKTPLTSGKGDYPMVEINAIIGDGMIINISDCKKFVGEELYNTWFRKGHPKRGDVLFSTVGSIGEIAFVFDEIFCIAQNIVGLRSKYGKYMYLLLKSIQGNLKALDISSVQPSIKLPHLLDYDIVIPDEIIIKEFETKVSPIFEKINNNGKQINTLISTRDQLLPKLMSGEVRVEF